MVLVNNEWQSKCEDVPKTAANPTTAAITITTEATTSLPESESESTPSTERQINAKNQNKSETTAAIDSNNTITSTSSIILKSTITTGNAIICKTLANDNADNEQINEINNDKNSIEISYKNNPNDDDDDDINECKIAEVGKLFSTAKQAEKEETLDKSILNYNNRKKIMAENIKEPSIKDEKKEEEESQPQNLFNNQHTENNKDIEELNSYQNSNTNTLTTPHIIVKTQHYNRPKQHTLSGGLQTALNITSNGNSNIPVAAAGLQPNFFSQLALTANVAGLQKDTATSTTILTAKQLNESLKILDTNNQNKNDSNLLEETTSTSVPVITYENNGQAKIVLICESNSHPFQTRTISLTPNVECMVGRLIAKSKASENNAIFDCKVLSRKHAVIWYTPDAKFWVKDTKSSNGTFINDNKLGDEEAQLHFGDIVKFGVDVLENSRKEVHGCIIACVKLYLPDGREAISIDSSPNRTQYSGEGRINYDELHRLNLYIQETSQREKALTSKLCNIQNVLDATRKNSALCWQSMITEDQLLHRIHSLEKKLQFMEKNVPESTLRNEVLKLLDDKSSYQHTAKEALRKVYQERCEAMQMLAKMESAYSQADNECSILRDKITNAKQTLQDVYRRLLLLETEYNEYKDEVARQQRKATEHEEQRITVLTEKLRESELECEELKKKISELLIKRAELLEDEEQAIEKLDAAIAGDDEDSSDEDYDGNKDEEAAKEAHDIVDLKFAINTKNPTVRPQLSSLYSDQFNGVEEEQQQDILKYKPHALKLSKLQNTKPCVNSKQKSLPKRVNETTIMKWLQNSDINKNEGSFDIFKAICNQNELDDDESEGCGILTECMRMQEDSFAKNENNLFGDFTNKLKNVQKIIEELEAEIEKETKNISLTTDDLPVKVKSEDLGNESSDVDTREGAYAKEELIIKRNGKQCISSDNQVLPEEKKYLLLKSSVNMLKEAYNEILESVKGQDEQNFLKQDKQYNEKEKSPPLNIKVKTQLQSYNIGPTTLAAKKFTNQPKLRSSESDNSESDSEVESLTLSSTINSTHSGTVLNVKTDTKIDQLLEQLREYQYQVGSLNEKLQQTELDAQHTLEIMQVNCDDLKLKMENLNKDIEILKEDKKTLEEIINKNQNKTAVAEKSALKSIVAVVCEENNVQMENELELEEDIVLNAINVTELEREEELITYKERLEEKINENIYLRNEIALLKQKVNAGNTKYILLKQYLPYSVIVLAIIIYFLTIYY